tara:strand:- start:671 stop:2017 length:1347 start_codon:yes stop_codon:yes gene_type:complete
MAIQTPIESLPLFLQQIFRERGVYPELNTGVDQSSSVNSFVPPRRRRLNVEGGMEGDFDEPLLPESTESVDIINTLRGLFSSEDPYDPEANMYYSLQENQTSLGSSFLDGVKNISDTIGKEVTEDLTKGLNSLTNLGSTLTNELSGLFSLDGLSDLFSLDSLIGSVPSIEDRYGPTGFIDAGLTALRDPYLSTGQKAGQALGGILGAGASAVIPGASVLGLFSALAGRAGAHHDFDPSTDYNLNFDTRSGRTDWGSLSPGAGGVQYGSLSNENMIEDIAKDNPDYEISLNNGRDGYITAENWVAANEGLKAGNAAFGFNLDNPFEGYTQTDYFAAAADSSGGMFGKLGNQTVGDALTEYEATGTGAIQNIAGAAARERGLGYNDQQKLADALALGIKGTQAIAPEMSSMYNYNPDPDGIGTDFDADDGMGSMGSMGFGEGDFGTDGII